MVDRQRLAVSLKLLLDHPSKQLFILSAEIRHGDHLSYRQNRNCFPLLNSHHVLILIAHNVTRPFKILQMSGQLVYRLRKLCKTLRKHQLLPFQFQKECTLIRFFQKRSDIRQRKTVPLQPLDQQHPGKLFLAVIPISGKGIRKFRPHEADLVIMTQSLHAYLANP